MIIAKGKGKVRRGVGIDGMLSTDKNRNCKSITFRQIFLLSILFGADPSQLCSGSEGGGSNIESL